MKNIENFVKSFPFVAQWTGLSALYDNEGVTKFIPSQIVIIADDKMQVVVSAGSGRHPEYFDGYVMTPNHKLQTYPGVLFSREFLPEEKEEAVRAYYAISYAWAHRYMDWPPPSPYIKEFEKAGYSCSV